MPHKPSAETAYQRDYEYRRGNRKITDKRIRRLQKGYRIRNRGNQHSPGKPYDNAYRHRDGKGFFRAIFVAQSDFFTHGYAYGVGNRSARKRQ